MGRIYTITANGSETAAGDMLEILVPSDAVMLLHEVMVSQSNIEADANSEQLTVAVTRVTGAPTSGSGGGTPTPIPIVEGDAAAGITAESFNSTDLSGGTSVTLWEESFNNLAGMTYRPKQPIEFSPSTRCLIKLTEAPAASTTFDVMALVEELGG